MSKNETNNTKKKTTLGSFRHKSLRFKFYHSLMDYYSADLRGGCLKAQPRTIYSEDA